MCSNHCIYCTNTPFQNLPHDFYLMFGVFFLQLWDFTFKKLKVEAKDRNVLLTLTPSDIMSAAGYKSIREKMAQIMFEKFECPGVFIANQPVLALYASGHMEGCVVSCGHHKTQCVPVEKGFAVPDAVTILNYAGQDISKVFAKSLGDRVPSSTRVEMEVVSNIKEKVGYVTLDLEQELKKPAAKIEESYKLPSGQEVTVGNERFQCPEALFQPSLLGMESAGIHEACYNSIMKCKEDVRKTMLGSVVLSGGTTLFHGLTDRFTAEMMALALPANRIAVVSPSNRGDAVWCGASILAAMENFQSMWVFKKEYEESGTSILHEKCR